MTCPLRAGFWHTKYLVPAPDHSGSHNGTNLCVLLKQNIMRMVSLTTQNCKEHKTPQYFYLGVYHFVLKFANSSNSNLLNDYF